VLNQNYEPLSVCTVRRAVLMMFLGKDPSAILRGLAEKFESHHGVRIQDSAILAAARLSHRYIRSLKKVEKYRSNQTYQSCGNYRAN